MLRRTFPTPSVIADRNEFAQIFKGRQNKNALATVCEEMKTSPQQRFDCVWSKGFSNMFVLTEQPSSMRA